MSFDGFWAAIDAQLAALRTAQNADDVMRILSNGKGGAFFGGSGGDDQVMYALQDAGWRITWSEAVYYFEATAPDGSAVTYTEGDIYPGKHE